MTELSGQPDFSFNVKKNICYEATQNIGKNNKTKTSLI